MVLMAVGCQKKSYNRLAGAREELARRLWKAQKRLKYLEKRPPRMRRQIVIVEKIGGEQRPFCCSIDTSGHNGSLGAYVVASVAPEMGPLMLSS